jgi:hypothetical protein
MATVPKHSHRVDRRILPRPRRHLRLIPGGAPEPKARPARPGIPFVAVASVAVGALVFGLVFLHIMLAQNSFRLADLQSKVAVEQDRHLRMRYQIAGAESPGRVADAAKSMGLVAPADRRYVVEGP